MTKPSYEELESELTRLRAEWYSPAQYSDLRQKAESARRDYEAAHKLWRDEEQKLARVRGLLQRIHGYFCWRVSPDSKGRHIVEDDVIRQTNKLCESGAESADIGKLDRMDEVCSTCKRPAGYVIGSINESKVRRDTDDLTESKSSSITYPGSAETGGEKAAPQHYLSVERRKEAVWDAVRLSDHAYDDAVPDSQGKSRPQFIGEAAIKAFYADYDGPGSREPEKLNNAQPVCFLCDSCGTPADNPTKYCSACGRAGKFVKVKRLAESSLSSPPPKECGEFRGNDPKACSTCQRPVQDHRCIVWHVEYLTREEVEKRYPRK